MKASFWGGGEGSVSGERRETEGGREAHPVLAEHAVGEVHADSGDEARLGPQEAVVEEGGLDEELGQGAGLDVVVVRLGDSADPRVRRAVRRDGEVEALNCDAGCQNRWHGWRPRREGGGQTWRTMRSPLRISSLV